MLAGRQHQQGGIAVRTINLHIITSKMKSINPIAQTHANKTTSQLPFTKHCNKFLLSFVCSNLLGRCLKAV